MRFLFDQLRPQVDVTSLYDEESGEAERPPRVTAARWKVVLTYLIIVLFGLALLLGAVVIGIRVDWVLTDTIAWKATRIWAWVAMGIISILGGGMAWLGTRLFFATRRAHLADAESDSKKRPRNQ
ncbi:MAG: hypothetical protein ACTH8F_00150 [Microbacterium sp.]|uniref:hypothetical protein n=1 Tax=Microbacterium sp. TaxID=51671 RepID=UPI003F993705